ncbi:hypothetical protein [Nonomuraea harbinensis]|uniref:WD40 repeat domain-containing protein n=1 Tax=Nonomuraea harbinensis TaxID=1286938 RepID=A0ABW1BW24_9ACTN|nr:hypothetical protein [Nonomuraea harbinensis]
MSTELEAGLRRALGKAAERAPRAPSDLSGRMVTRSRKRRARGQALIAAVAVVVIAGGVGAVVRGAGNDSGPASERSEIEIPRDAREPETTPGGPFQTDQPGEPETTPGRQTDQPGEPEATSGGPPQGDRQPPAKIPPALEKVWPDAVWRIPDKLPNGREYHPRAFIDDHTILVETWAGHELANAIYAYDVETRKARKITDIRTSTGKHADGFQVVGDRVYFEAFGDSGASRFWWVPVRGGEPREIRMTETIRGRSDAFAVAGDRLAFSLGENGGVYTVPIKGGAPTPVPGAERHHILRWPWVGTPGEYTPDNEPSFQRLLNAETGETSTAVVHPGEQYVRCGVTHCAGVRQDGSGFHRLRDGSDERDLPPGAHAELAADRFTTGPLARFTDGQVLYDVRTGRSAHLEHAPSEEGGVSVVRLRSAQGPLVAHRLPGEYQIVNLDGID